MTRNQPGGALRAATGLAALAALLASCSEPAPAPLRLTAAPAAVKQRCAGIRAELPAEPPSAGFGTLPRANEPRMVPMNFGKTGRDSRQALLAPTPSDYRFRLRVPPGKPVLETGLGYVIVPADAGARVRFRIKVTSADGSTETVLDESFETAAADTWRDRSISLEPWAGDEVTLVLRTRGAGRDRPQVVAAWSAPEVRTSGAAQPRWNLILVSLDTLRADRLSSYGYERDTSPNLDRLAARSFLFRTAISQSSWTRPAHRSLFTGLYPIARGQHESRMLATEIWKAGYRTAAFTGGAQMRVRFGFHVGFESFRVHSWVRDLEPVGRWLESLGDRSFFLYLHTYEIHSPYQHTQMTSTAAAGRIGSRFSNDRGLRPLTEAERAHVSDLYDGGVQFTDRAMGRLLTEIERLGLADRTAIAIFSDHGEDLWEHGKWGHGFSMWEAQIRVPLILHLPEGLRRELGIGARGGAIDQQVELMDLYPTLLELLGVPLEHSIQARSLVPLLRGEKLPDRDAFSESTRAVPTEVKSLRSGRYKLIWAAPKRGPEREPRVFLFDLRDDPEEFNDLSAELPEVTAALRARLEALISGSPPRTYEEEVPEDVPEDLRKELEALGYVGN